MNNQTRAYRQRQDLYSKIAVARLCGVSISVLQWHINNGEISEPTVGGKRKYYTPQEAEEITNYWAKFAK